MGDEEGEVEAPQRALVYGAETFIGAPLLGSLKAGGYEVEAATAESDVLGADVIFCNVYGKDAAELQNTQRALEALATAEQPKTLILISSVMTWGRTPVEMVSTPPPALPVRAAVPAGGADECRAGRRYRCARSILLPHLSHFVDPNSNR